MTLLNILKGAPSSQNQLINHIQIFPILQLAVSQFSRARWRSMSLLHLSRGSMGSPHLTRGRWLTLGWHIPNTVSLWPKSTWLLASKAHMNTFSHGVTGCKLCSLSSDTWWLMNHWLQSWKLNNSNWTLILLWQYVHLSILPSHSFGAVYFLSIFHVFLLYHLYALTWYEALSCPRISVPHTRFILLLYRRVTNWFDPLPQSFIRCGPS